MFATCLFLVHDATGRGQHEETKLTRWQQITRIIFDLMDFDIETWRNNTALVQSSGKINNNFAGTMIVDNFEFTDITYILWNKNKTIVSISQEGGTEIRDRIAEKE